MFTVGKDNRVYVIIYLFIVNIIIFELLIFLVLFSITQRLRKFI